MPSTPRILVIGPSWVGDMIMSQSLYIALKKQYPHCQIDVLAPEWCKAVLQRMPEVHQAISMPITHGMLALKQRRTLGKSLRGQYDWAIVLPNSWKSALIPYFARIPKRTGWRGEMRYGVLNDCRTLDTFALRLMVQRFAALAYDLPVPKQLNAPHPKLQATPTQINATLKHLKVTLKPKQRVLALCPGAAFGEAKRWGAAYYAQVADYYHKAGWQVWLLGAPSEQDTMDHINKLCKKRCTVFTENAPLEAKIDLLAKANLAICNDSGLLHIAAAVNTPLIGIYGSTSPDFTPPLGKKTKVMEIDTLACRPCFKRTCPLKGDQHLRCLRDITPEQVIETARSLGGV